MYSKFNAWRSEENAERFRSPRKTRGIEPTIEIDTRRGKRVLSKWHESSRFKQLRVDAINKAKALAEAERKLENEVRYEVRRPVQLPPLVKPRGLADLGKVKKR